MFYSDNVPCYGAWEKSWTASESKNPYDVRFKAIFKKGNRELTAFGFYDGNGVYKLRFMPDSPGKWTYKTESDISSLDGQNGEFVCIGAVAGSHGVARVNGHHFVHDDGTPLYPIGTTCYAWIHQPKQLRDKTIETLKKSKFKKMRMCVFPKHYDFNNNEPEIYPFEGERGAEYTRPNPAFYEHLEEYIYELGSMGIEVDLILFHAYDSWGFSTMDETCNHRYVKYVAARLSCFANIWWSLANEYDLLPHLDTHDWENFAQIISEVDYAGHLLSIHNCRPFYDHSRPWVTHCSIQRQDVYKTSEFTDKWIDEYKKPAVLDEIGYEGDINWGWGNLTAEELTRRAWECFVRGGYPGHGETYVCDDDVLWWSKGGILKGESAARFDFIAKLNEEIGAITYLPEYNPWDVPVGGIKDKVYIAYFGFNRPRFRDFYFENPMSKLQFPEGSYKVEIIDTWEMTIKDCGVMPFNEIKVELPGKPYMAVRLTKIQ